MWAASRLRAAQERNQEPRLRKPLFRPSSTIICSRVHSLQLQLLSLAALQHAAHPAAACLQRIRQHSSPGPGACRLPAEPSAPHPAQEAVHHRLLPLLHALQAISRGVTKAGVGVDTLNLEVVTLEDVVAAIKKADGFILGAALMGFVF